MSDLKTFNENDVKSIAEFRNVVRKLDETQVNDDFLWKNIKKAIDSLKLLKQDEYKNDRTKQLLGVIWNLAFLCKSQQLIEDIISSDLYSIYNEMINYHLKLANWDSQSLNNLFGGIWSLTTQSEIVAKENVKNNLIEMAINVFKAGNFLCVEKLNDDIWFDLYDKLTSFLMNNSSYKEITKEHMIQIGTINFLMNNLNELNKNINKRKELKYIKVNMIMAIVHLLSDEEIDKLTITNDIVHTIVDGLNEAIQNSKTNQKVIHNTKYYSNYTINNSTTYTNALEWINCLIKISVNDLIKQKLYATEILVLLPELLENGNSKEKIGCCSLLCLLCFNENIRKTVKQNDKIIKLLEDIINDSDVNESAKRNCQQIIEMVNEVLEQRLNSARELKNDRVLPNGHVMISYSHAYKSHCLEIFREINKKGFQAWIDVETDFNDLRDAMAKAVENASVVLICYSEEYKQSGNCRYEAEYAANLNKSIIAVRMQPKFYPDGWLGLILASKLYVDFSKYNTDSSVVYNKLFRQIECVLNQKDSQTTKSAYQQPITPFNRLTSAKAIDDPKRWSCQDIINWFKLNNLENLSNAFSKYNGTALRGLYQVQQKNHDEFRNMVEKEIENSKINVELFEKLAFYELLQSLFETNV